MSRRHRPRQDIQQHPVTYTTICLLAAVFILQQLFPTYADSLYLGFSAVPDRLHTLGSYALLHTDLRHLFINTSGVWVFGRILERHTSRPMLAGAYLVGAVGTGVFLTGMHTIDAITATRVIGFSGVTTVLIGFALVTCPRASIVDRELQLPGRIHEIWQHVNTVYAVGGVLIILIIYEAAMYPQAAGKVAHLFGGAVGVLYGAVGRFMR